MAGALGIGLSMVILYPYHVNGCAKGINPHFSIVMDIYGGIPKMDGLTWLISKKNTHLWMMTRGYPHLGILQIVLDTPTCLISMEVLGGGGKTSCSQNGGQQNCESQRSPSFTPPKKLLLWCDPISSSLHAVRPPATQLAFSLHVGRSGLIGPCWAWALSCSIEFFREISRKFEDVDR